MSKLISGPPNLLCKFNGILPLLCSRGKWVNRALRLTLILALAASWVQPRQAQAQQPDPSKPSKEYIYLGGRLIATEEGPQGTIFPQDLTPTISNISPNLSLPGESFTLTVTGTNLFSGSTISFDPSGGITVGAATSSLQNTQLTASVSVPLNAPQGPYLVVVDNGHGKANAPFTISETQGGGQFTIAFDQTSVTNVVAGTNLPARVVLDWSSGVQFNSSSAVWINGSLYANHSQLVSQSATQIKFDLQPAATALPGVLDITVQTSISGAVQVSNSLSFVVTSPSGPPNPFPIIFADSLTPRSITAGTGPTDVSISSLGASFNNNSLLIVNGVIRGTSYELTSGGTRLHTTILASDVPHAGSLAITVFNPHPGGCATTVDGPICGFALNTLSIAILPATTPQPGPFSIALQGNAWAKVPPGDPDAQGTLNITGPLTVEAWIFPKSLNGRQAIVERYDATPGSNKGGYGLRLNDGGTVTFSTYQSPTDFDSITSAAPVSSFQWHHVAGVFDGAQLGIYIDGYLNASSTCSSGCRAPKRAPYRPLLMGASADASGSGGFFTGDLDEVRVSSSAVYTGASFTVAQNLPAPSGTGLWKFDDQTLNDSSGNHHDAIGKGGSIQFSTNVPGFTGTESLMGETGGGNLPTLGSVTKASASPGDPQFQFTVYGTNLAGGLTLTPLQSSSGITVSPVSSSATQATANVTIGPLADPGAYLITVGNSDTVVFQVNPVAPNPSPSVGANTGGALTPSSLAVGTAIPQSITLTGGNNFILTSRVHINGSPRVTHFISSGSLTADLVQEDLETEGPLTVKVYNPPSVGGGGGESQDSLTFTVTGPADNPVPNLSQLCVDTACTQPPTVLTGSSNVLLRVRGSNFVQGTQIVFNGAPRTDTRFINSGELDLNPSTSDISNFGAQPKQIPVTVNTPPPGGGEPTTPPFQLQLTVTPVNPIPTITSLAVNGVPPNITAGGPQFTLQVTGTGFVGSGSQTVSYVKVNGQSRQSTTQYVSATELDVQITPTDINAPGQLEITVFSPTPGGGTSDPALLTVQPAGNPAPHLQTLSLTRVQVDTTTQTNQTPVMLTGSGFMAGSRVLVNGFPRTTNPFNSSDPTHLTVQVPDSDFAVLGQLLIEVSNPEPGGGTSNTLPLAVFAPAPTLNSNGISPTSATAGPNPVTITLTGTNFIDESTVLVNNVSRAAAVVPDTGGTQLSATLTSDVASGGTLTIAVSNPTTGGGGGTSATALSFIVNNPQPATDQTTPLTPATVTAGTGAQSISVFGTGFVPTSQVTINNTNRAIYQDPNHLNVSILATDIQSGGTIPIQVFNPAPPTGGLSSATVNLTINNPRPALDPNTPLAPAIVYVCSGSQNITVLGTGFVPTSQVMINNTNRATFVDPTHLSVSIQAADITASGQIGIQVVNPTPGGGQTNTVYLQVNNPLPTLSGLSRVSATQGESDAPFNINVLGTNFVSNSVVQFNPGSINHAALPGGTCSSLTIQITPADLSTATQYTVTVINPTPGGGTSPAPSPAVTFTVNTPPPNPATVSSISPTVVIVGANPTPTLTVNGSNFVVGPPSSVVVINGASHPPLTTPAPTTTKLSISLSGDDVSAPAGAYPVTVVNPNGAISNNNVTLTLANPPQQAGNLLPSSATTNMSPLPQLTIMGSGFAITGDPNTSATAQINGGTVHQAIAGSDSTHLIIQLIPADVAASGRYTVTWKNPGGGPTAVNPSFAVFDAPRVDSISPNSATIGGTPPQVAVNGANFTDPLGIVNLNVAVNLNGRTHYPIANPQPPCANSATQLCMLLTQDDLNATAGVYPVTAVTTTPGGVSNNTVAFTLNNPQIGMSSLSQSTVVAGSGPQTLNVTGTGFVPATTVTINGQNRATYVSPTQLQVSILASETATAGSIPITAVNAPPGGGSGTLTFTVNNPTPTISNLSPTSATAGSAAFTLAVNGTNFVSGATVKVNGNSRTTTFVSATQLTASIPASDITSAGTLSITVVNPAPSSGTSAAATFTVNNPVPTISSLSPSSATAGGAAFTVTVNGTNLVSGATVKVNGSSRTTTFVSATQLTASIPASDITSAGTLSITVVNPAPSTGASGAATFTVNNPVPTISSLSPTTATAGGAAFTLTVNGANYVSGATVKVNGNSRTTTFVSATQLTASIPASDIASAATLSVTVVNPAPGGGASSAASFTVNSAAPVISGLSPQSVAAGGPDFTLTITGSNFINGATVQISDLNGTLSGTRSATFVSSTQLTVQMFASDIASADTIYLAVVTSSNSGGGGTSNTAAMSVH